MPGSRDPRQCLPLTPPVFHVLLTLAEGEAHGYAIAKDVAARTGGRVRLGTGTLYGIVKRLLADGLIEECRTRAAGPHAGKRRAYRLTPFGRDVARAEARRLADMVAAARAIRLIGRAEPA